MIRDRGALAGNLYDKYGTRDPIARWLVRRFVAAVADLAQARDGERVVEIGAGEGELLARLVATHRPRVAVAGDISPLVLREARRRRPELRAIAHSATALALGDRSVDLVIGCEVLEHLPDPDAALCEIARVVRRRAVLSVPREPLWRLLNLARGAHLRDLGNTPGHVQHFSRGAFARLVARRLRVVAVRSPLPWTVVAAEPR